MLRQFFSGSALREQSRALANARRDLVVLTILIAAVFLLIWNGTELFQRISLAKSAFGPGLKVTLIAMTLNVALILFGWRRYVDLQHETEMRQQGEARAALTYNVSPEAILEVALSRTRRRVLGPSPGS